MLKKLLHVFSDQRLKKARKLEKQNRWEEARAIYERHLVRANGPLRYYFRLGFCTENLGDLDAAIDAYGKALKTKEPPAVWYYRLGVVSAKRGDTRQAVLAFQEAVRRHPVVADRWLHSLVNAAEKAGEWMIAESCYRELLARDNGSLEWLVRLAKVLMRLEKKEDVEQILQQIRGLVPSEAGMLYLKWGQRLEEQGCTDEAAAAYRNALRSNPGALMFDGPKYLEPQPYPSSSSLHWECFVEGLHIRRVRPKQEVNTAQLERGRLANWSCRTANSLDYLDAARATALSCWQQSYLDSLRQAVLRNRDWFVEHYPELKVEGGDELTVAGTWSFSYDSERGSLLVRAISPFPVSTVFLFVNDRVVHAVNTRRLNTSLGESVAYFQFFLRQAFLDALPKVARMALGSEQGVFSMQDGSAELWLQTDGGKADMFDLLDKGYRMNKRGQLMNPAVNRSVEWQQEILAAYSEFAVYFKRRFELDLFITYGVLLGITREGDFIANDDDLDVAFFSSRTSVEEVKKQMIAIVRGLAADGWAVSVNPSRRMFKVDVKGFELDCFAGWEEEGRVWMHNTTSFVGDGSIFAPARRMAFKGIDVLLPNRPEVFLEGVYGSGWRTPDPGYQAPIRSPEIKAHLRKGCLSRVEYAQLIAEGVLVADQEKVAGEVGG